MSWDIDHLRKIAGLTESYESTSQVLTEAWDDDDEDPDVARMEREASKRKMKMPDVKVDAERDLSKIAGAKKSAAKEEADEAAEEREAAERAAAKKKEEADSPKADAHDEHEKKESPAKEKAEHGGSKPSPAAEKKESAASEKKEEDKAAEKPAEKAEDKKEESTEAKRRGKARSDTSKTGQLRTWIINHPGAKRAEAWKHAVDTLGLKSEDNPGGITPAGFSTLYQKARSQQEGYVSRNAKKDVKEAWILMHPLVHNHVLHENAAMNQYQWVHFLDENQDPMIFESKEAAQKVATYLADFKNQSAIIEHVVFDDE